MTATPTADFPAVKRQPIAGPPSALDQLVIQTSFLGDMVLTTPLIAELAQRGPVDVLTHAGRRAACSRTIRTSATLHVYDKRGADARRRGIHRMAQALREGVRGHRRTHRVAYLAQGSLRSGALAALARVSVNASASQTPPGRLFYTIRVARRDDLHHAERLCARLPVESAASSRRTTRCARGSIPAPSERAAVDALLGTVVAGDRFIALAPGSVWATKRWPYYRGSPRCLAAPPPARDHRRPRRRRARAGDRRRRPRRARASTRRAGCRCSRRPS